MTKLAFRSVADHEVNRLEFVFRASMSDSNIPLRDERRVCYIARDAFFTCCDKNSIDNPLKDVDSVLRVCRREKANFEKDCIASWVRVSPTFLKLLWHLLITLQVEYFMRKRIVDKRKELMYANETKLAAKWRRIGLKQDWARSCNTAKWTDNPTVSSVSDKGTLAIQK